MQLLMRYPNYQRLMKEWPEETQALLFFYLPIKKGKKTMLKIESTEVVGWEAAIRGMRNPMNSWEKSDSCFGKDPCRCDYCDHLTWECYDQKFNIGPNDLDLMTRLCNAGTDHRKFMRMITVYLDITAPLYW